MTPGEYKRRGVGLEISYGFHDTPFGECLLATTDRGICGLHFVQARHFVQAEHLAEGNARSAALETLTRDWPRATFVEEPRQTQPFVDRIFAPDVIQQSRPFHLLLKGTNFQVKVWQALLAIPPGSMVSYQDLATYIGLPSAARAVGRALAKQPIAYLIPCHRVISKGGKAHQYRWGSTRKRAILGWEASHRTRTE
jgi:AraC family transcriptional regulator of adaptative response/methylated-DNA-[protein]-cysteine methyltransferase